MSASQPRPAKHLKSLTFPSHPHPLRVLPGVGGGYAVGLSAMSR